MAAHRAAPVGGAFHGGHLRAREVLSSVPYGHARPCGGHAAAMRSRGRAGHAADMRWRAAARVSPVPRPTGACERAVRHADMRTCGHADMRLGARRRRAAIALPGACAAARPWRHSRAGKIDGFWRMASLRLPGECSVWSAVAAEKGSWVSRKIVVEI